MQRTKYTSSNVTIARLECWEKKKREDHFVARICPNLQLECRGWLVRANLSNIIEVGKKKFFNDNLTLLVNIPNTFLIPATH